MNSSPVSTYSYWFISSSCSCSPLKSFITFKNPFIWYFGFSRVSFFDMNISLFISITKSFPYFFKCPTFTKLLSLAQATEPANSQPFFNLLSCFISLAPIIDSKSCIDHCPYVMSVRIDQHHWIVIGVCIAILLSISSSSPESGSLDVNTPLTGL